MTALRAPIAWASESNNYPTLKTRGAPGHRKRLRLLDACLQLLEDAHERGTNAVPAELSSRFANFVPAIQPGMLISDALEMVFAEQARHLAAYGGGASETLNDLRAEPRVAASLRLQLQTRTSDANHRAANGHSLSQVGMDGAPEPLTEAEARSLTDKIRSNMRKASLLLLAAYQRHAWSPLGYATWEQYVRSEFGLSRSRSYELLDHGRVLSAIQVAANLSEIPDISAYAAAQIKPRLREITREIQSRAEGLSADRVSNLIGEIIHDVRSRYTVQHVTEPPGAAPILHSNGRPGESASVYNAVALLAGLPRPRDFAMQIPLGDRDRLAGLSRAAAWLADFAEAWEKRMQDQLVNASGS